MRALLVSMLCLALLPVSQAYATPDWVAAIGTEQPPPFLLGDDRITHVAKGSAAPYEGVLLDLDTAARWTMRIDWGQKQLRLDADILRAVMVQELAAKDKLLQLSQKSYEREIEGLRGDLRDQAKTFAKSQQPTPFYKTGAFGLAMGVVLSGLSAVALAALVKE